ncbi:recombinase family protein [Burkholderia ubonensis]|uniref:recombinase family protein n=1 Tax=Burkholderia ubonensis TaxID=101571 RepID=UPI0009B3F2CC|nr:recombinase family protein [Burkholderia ubonensis]
MLIGYARVSTEEQHLDLQLSALQRHGCDPIFSDQGISGVCFVRPGLQKVMQIIQPGDTLVVWRLDRLGRSLADLVDLVTKLNGRDVQFASLTELIDTVSPTGRFTFHVMAALAEFERSLISERTRAGLESARQRGQRIGRPAGLTFEQLEEARAQLSSDTLGNVARRFSVHANTLRRHLRRSATE